LVDKALIMWTAYTGRESLLGATGRVIRVTAGFNYPPVRLTPERAHGGRVPSRSVCDFVDLPTLDV
jgi:hypothetical protein